MGEKERIMIVTLFESGLKCPRGKSSLFTYPNLEFFSYQRQLTSPNSCNGAYHASQITAIHNIFKKWSIISQNYGNEKPKCSQYKSISNLRGDRKRRKNKFYTGDLLSEAHHQNFYSSKAKNPFFYFTIWDYHFSRAPM